MTSFLSQQFLQFLWNIHTIPLLLWHTTWVFLFPPAPFLSFPNLFLPTFLLPPTYDLLSSIHPRLLFPFCGPKSRLEYPNIPNIPTDQRSDPSTPPVFSTYPSYLFTYPTDPPPNLHSPLPSSHFVFFFIDPRPGSKHLTLPPPSPRLFNVYYQRESESLNRCIASFFL